MAAKTKAKTRPMPRASAKITLMFGMVSIPVAMRPAAGERRGGIRGRLLCPEHKEPLEQFYQCSHDEKKPHLMKKGETVTGYETAQDSGQYVVLDDDVIESLVQDREAAAMVRQVVPTDTIDPIFYEKTYTLWPQEGAGQPHDLFTAVLRELRWSAILTATISTQTRSFAVRWCEPQNCLVASLLYFDSDLRWEDGEAVAASVEDRAGSITDEHVAMARSLVEGMLGEFDASEVTDTYAEALSEAIEAAAAGVQPTPSKAKAPQAAGVDLLDTLKASVAASAKPKAKKAKAAA